jgi:hypothetical protein
MNEIENMEDYEKSIGDRLYLGTLIAIGFVLGIGCLMVLISCYIKVLTGQWPQWI